MMPVRLEPAALRSRVKHSTTEPLRSLDAIPEAPILALTIFYLINISNGRSNGLEIFGYFGKQ